MTDDEFEKLMDETRYIYEDLKDKLKQIPTPKIMDIEKIGSYIKSFNDNFLILSKR